MVSASVAAACHVVTLASMSRRMAIVATVNTLPRPVLTNCLSKPGGVDIRGFMDALQSKGISLPAVIYRRILRNDTVKKILVLICLFVYLGVDKRLWYHAALICAALASAHGQCHSNTTAHIHILEYCCHFLLQRGYNTASATWSRSQPQLHSRQWSLYMFTTPM